jgi:hypothetical protein
MPSFEDRTKLTKALILVANCVFKATHVLGLAYVFTAYPAMVVYNDNILTDYIGQTCTSPFYNDLDVVRSAANGLFVTSIFVIFMATVSARLEYITSTTFNNVAVYGGIAGFIVSGLLSLEVVIGGSCDMPIPVVPANTTLSVNEYVGVSAGFTMILAVVLGVLICDFGLDNSVGHFRFNGTSYNALVNWVVRFFLGVTLITIMGTTDEAKFRAHYIDETRYNSIACEVTRANVNVADTYMYKNYYLPTRIVDLDNYNPVTGQIITAPPTEQMTGLASATIAFLVVELFGRLVELYWAKHDINEKYGLPCVVTFTRILTLFSFISFGIFISSFVLANEITACPIFDVSGNTALQCTCILFALVLGVSTLHVVQSERDSPWSHSIITSESVDTGDHKEALVSTNPRRSTGASWKASSLTRKLFAADNM